MTEPKAAKIPFTKVLGNLDYADWRDLAAVECQTQSDVLAQQAAQHRQWASDLRAEVGRCHHCGKPDEADGDHSCPCPYRDEECHDHPKPSVR